MSNRRTQKLIERILGPGQRVEIDFVPGAPTSIETGAINDGDALIVLELLHPGESAAPPGRRDQGTQPVLQVSEQAPAALVGKPWKVRVTSRGSVPTRVVLDVKYSTAEALQRIVVPRAKLDALADTAVREAKPSIKLEGERLVIGLDPSLSKDHGGSLSRELDLPFSLKIFDLESESIRLRFKAADADFIAGSIELTVTCKKDITIAAPLGVRFILKKPTFVARVGITLLGGSIHLRPVVLQLPPVDGKNWIGGMLSGAVDIRQKATAKLTALIEGVVANLESTGKLADITRRIQTTFGMRHLESVEINKDGLQFEFVAAAAPGPMPATSAAGPARSSRLQHLVIVMMENRSFDHMMASLVADRTDVDRPVATYEETYQGKKYRRDLTTLHTLPHDPPHGSDPQKLQANGEFVRSFLEGNPGSPYGNEVLSYQPRQHVPFYAFLTENYCICDNWRAALPGHTWPNRLYSLSGSSNDTLDNPDMSRLSLYTLPTVCDVLEAQGISWAYYKEDFAFLELYRRWAVDNKRIHSRDQLDTAVREANAGTAKFPTVAWVEPNISDFGNSLGSDDHPPIGILPGQAFLASVYESLRALDTKDWLLVITYDENGGFYDHVGPEAAPDDGTKTNRRGFRVPAFFVSPWLAPGTVCKTKFDHASLIRTILDQFCNPEPLFDQNVTRVRTANSFATILEPTSSVALTAPRTPPKFEGVTLPIAIGGADSLWLGGDVPTPQRHPLLARFVELRDELAQRSTQLELAALSMGAAGVPPTQPPAEPVRFEALYVRSLSLIPELANAGWTATPEFDDAVIATPPVPISVDAAWDLVHDLRERHPALTIDPLWETVLPETRPREQEQTLGLAGGAGTAAPQDKTWQLTMLNAKAAWSLRPDHGTQQGDGIVIGHLDTGYRKHPDLDAMWLPAFGWDVFDDDPDPTDELIQGPLLYPGHGTSTAGVIASRGGTEPVVGTAPKARLIPFRISTTVIHLSMKRMVTAIRRAVEAGCHVISISAGGLWSAALHRAVREATDAGVIIVAAAGNFTKVVVWPARFSDEVVACGAVSHDGSVWAHSNGGDGERVDVMAPGADVWVLRPHSDNTVTTAPGSGTSFATACVAGAIATWLGYHGRNRLIAMYGRPNLGHVIKHLIETTTRTAGNAGILDMKSLLEAALPDPSGVQVVAPSATPGLVSLDQLGLATATGVQPTESEKPFADELAFHAMVAALTSGTSPVQPSAHLEIARRP